MVNPDISNGNGFEIVLGTPFLRNVYSVYVILSPFIVLKLTASISYDFGNPFASDDKGPTPYMQLLAETDPQTAASEAVAARQSTLSHLPPELSSGEISQLVVPNSSSGISASTDISETDSQTDSQSAVEKYAPLVIGLLGANLLIGLILVVLGVLGCIRRGTRGTTKSPAARTSYAPVGTKEEDSVDMAYHMPYTTR
jgi:saccharopepsin